MTRATFVMEQHIGHRSLYLNVRRTVEEAAALDARWVEVTYENGGSAAERLPFLTDHWRGSLAGRAQVRQGLQAPYDVAFFNTQVPAALAGRLVQQRPYVLCTDITPLQYDDMAEHYGHSVGGNRLLNAYKHRANVRLFQQAASVVPWSNWAADSLRRDYGVAAEAIHVIPPGVNVDRWQFRPRPLSGRIRVLFIGGDFYRKGGDVLLAALTMLPPDSAECHIVTRTQLEPAPNCTVYNDMTPNSAELIALGQTCDVFVLPTRAEAFGIAAVEAAALGLPVVASAVGGIGDIVLDGETGFLIAPDDPATLAQRLNALRTNHALRQRLSHAARAHAENNFDAEKNGRRIIDLLTQVASTQSGALPSRNALS